MSKLVSIIALVLIFVIGIALGSWIADDSKAPTTKGPRKAIPSDERVVGESSPRLDAKPQEPAPSVDRQEAAQKVANSSPASWDSESMSSEDFASSSSAPIELSDAQLSQLREINQIAADLAETYDTTGYTPPEIPKDIEEKLRALSPELLTLVQIASRIPPRQAAGSKTSAGK